MNRKVAILIIILTFVSISVFAGGSTTRKDILFLGANSTYWNDGLETHFEQLANSAKHRLIIEADKFAESHATLKKLWGNKVWSDEVHELIDSGNYDFVILQLSISLADADTFFINQTDKRLWDWITLTENAQVHQKIASELGAKVAPVGLAMQHAKEKRPECVLISDDKVHPTLHGTYLYICVIYATIFDRSPIGISYTPEDFFTEVTEEEAVFLQRIAWETVQEYRGQ